MSFRLLSPFVLLVACKTSSISLPRPTATTAFLTDTTSDYSASQLDAVDVVSHAMINILPATAYPAQALTRTFAHNLYITGQDSLGDGNNMLVLSPDAKYAPACAKSIAECQFSLPALFDAQDFWVANANKMYLTPYMTADGTGPAGAVSNSVYIYDPLTGQRLGGIDIAAGAKALGQDLLAIGGDGTLNLGAMYQVDNHLFVAVQLLVAGPPDPTYGYIPQVPETANTACGFVPGRVVVIDTDTDKVVKVLTLSGTNPQAPFVVEPGTSNLVIATPGSLGTFDQEPCNGIDRIDTAALESKGLAVSEAQLSNGNPHGGTVFSFDLDSKGNGLAFTGNGSTSAPDYPLIRFNLKTGFMAQIQDAGVKGLTSNGFIVANGQGQGYVSLPSPSAPALYTYDIADGTLLGQIQLTEAAVGISFYPGQAFIAD